MKFTRNIPVSPPQGFRILVQCFNMSASEALAWIRRVFSTAKEPRPVVFRKGVWRMGVGKDTWKKDWTFEPDGGFIAFIKESA